MRHGARRRGGGAPTLGPPGGLGCPPGRNTDAGQASVELALALPFVFVLLLGLVQVGVVVRDQVLVVHAAREAVRQAAVGGMSDARRAATRAALAGSGLKPDRLQVLVHPAPGASDRVEARLQYRVPTEVVLVGRLIGDVTVEARAVMRRETRS